MKSTLPRALDDLPLSALAMLTVTRDCFCHSSPLHSRSLWTAFLIPSSRGHSINIKMQKSQQLHLVAHPLPIDCCIQGFKSQQGGPLEVLSSVLNWPFYKGQALALKLVELKSLWPPNSWDPLLKSVVTSRFCADNTTGRLWSQMLNKPHQYLAWLLFFN